jgi:hypothetical protein
MKNRLPKELQEFYEELGPAFEALVKKGGIRHAVLTEDGEVMECDLMTWAQWLEKNRSHRIIAQEELPGGYFLSTVFLGLNHQYAPRGKPLWFETMIFSPPTGEVSLITGKVHKIGAEVYCKRYSTLAEALAGHREAKETFQR